MVRAALACLGRTESAAFRRIRHELHFPAEYVNRLLAAYQIRFEPREVNQHGQRATVRYHCTLDPDTPLQRLSEQLTDASASGLKSVSWETQKKE